VELSPRTLCTFLHEFSSFRRQGAATKERRLSRTRFATFAIIALVLAVVGLYAVTACAVTQRTRDIFARRHYFRRSADLIVTAQSACTWFWARSPVG
jgi:hypothetical protein